MTELDQVVESYVNGELEAEALEQFEERLEQDPALLREWAGACFLDHELSKHYKRQATPKPEPAPAMSLAELARLEEAADAELVHVLELKGRRIRWTHPAVWIPSAAAAVALSALVVLLVIQGLMGAEDTQRPLVLDAPIAPRDTTSTPIVATLTAERGAVWGQQLGGDLRQGALRPGSRLAVGQRLVLSQGFAEITTARGAIAIIEAPASVELLDNENAVQLHSGKLVGICETDSSKGFLVRTPHLDITDLGTRFGVDVTENTTDIHVFEGEVQASHPDISADAQSVTLAADQSARISADTRLIISIDHDPDSFAALLPQTIHKLTGTGQGLKVGEIDPNWQIIAINGDPITESGHLTVRKPTPFIALKSPLANDPDSSQWLIVSREFEQSTWPECRYTIRTQFDLPAEIDPASTQLNLRFDAEQHIELVRLNGQTFDAPENSIDDDRNELNEMTIANAIVVGQNTVEFEVVDVSRNVGGFTWGLRVDWQLQKWPGASP